MTTPIAASVVETYFSIGYRVVNTFSNAYEYDRKFWIGKIPEAVVQTSRLFHRLAATLFLSKCASLCKVDRTFQVYPCLVTRDRREGNNTSHRKMWRNTVTNIHYSFSAIQNASTNTAELRLIKSKPVNLCIWINNNFPTDWKLHKNKWNFAVFFQCDVSPTIRI